MITRSHARGGCESQAVYSSDEAYRYALMRRWRAGPCLLFVMLNPSTATELSNDATIERCERRARMWGYGGLAVGNLFAWRATRPEDLKRAVDPVGPANDAVLLDLAGQADLILCAWGSHGRHLNRAAQVTRLLSGRGQALHHLALTRGGEPRHPLYLPYDLVPQVWR